MTSTALSPIAARFAWKEYRALRSFWLAALVIAAILQVVAITLAPRSADPVATVFAIALAAASLYAVGVAATTFSMEHEEETYHYLSSLPARWFPLFAGKLSFAAASSVALAGALTVTGWIFADFRFPRQDVTLATLGVFGFAIVEMLAWGMLFSLLLRQPLLAALLTIGAESLTLTIAVSYLSNMNLPALTLSSYLQVLPARLAIAVCLFAVDILLARRWLSLGATRFNTTISVANSIVRLSDAPHRVVHRAIQPTVAPIRFFGLGVLSRLLWQTCRASWRSALATTAVVALLILIVSEVRFARLELWLAFAPFCIGLVAAALYTSLVFNSDQRGRSYRFLAEHAVWPHFVWFARLAVWVIPALVVLAAAVLMKDWAARGLAAELYDIRSSSPFWQNHSHVINYFAGCLNFTIWGIFLGIAVGQACSLFFRRAIVAGFGAMVTAIPLLTWGFAIWQWELSPTVFLLPMILGLFAATWLRIPDWIIDRNSLRGWTAVGAAIIIPLVFVTWRLPAARELPVDNDQIALAQIAAAMGIAPTFSGDPSTFDASAVVANWTEQYELARTDGGCLLGDKLVRLSELIEKPLVNANAYDRRLVELNHEIADEAMPLCGEQFTLPPINNLDSGVNPTYDRLTTLVELLSNAGDVATEDSKLNDGLKYHLAALRLWDRLCDATSAGFTLSTSNRLRLQSRLVDWAGANGQTSDRIRNAISEVDTLYRPANVLPADDQFRIDQNSLANWSPPAPLMIEYLSLRDILTGEQPSSLLTRNTGMAEYLAVIVNQFPFERARALKLLDYLLIIRTAQWHQVASQVEQDSLQHPGSDGKTTGGLIQLACETSLEPFPEIVGERNYPPYSWLRTTRLLRAELERLGSFGLWLGSVADRSVSDVGLRQQLALIAYKLDHEDYPKSLNDLVPDYLPFVPIDPYSGRRFEYRRDGLPLELRSYEQGFIADSGFTKLSPHTPFLWSVGAGNGRLEIGVTIEDVNPNEDKSNFASDVHSEFYYFEGDPLDRLSQPLVFPLPK